MQRQGRWSVIVVMFATVAALCGPGVARSDIRVNADSILRQDPVPVRGGLTAVPLVKWPRLVDPSQEQRLEILRGLGIRKRDWLCVSVSVWEQDWHWGVWGMGGSGTPGGMEACPPQDVFAIFGRPNGDWETVYSGTSGIPCYINVGFPAGFRFPCVGPSTQETATIRAPSRVVQGAVLRVRVETNNPDGCTISASGPKGAHRQLDFAETVQGVATVSGSTKSWSLGRWMLQAQCGTGEDRRRLTVVAPHHGRQSITVGRTGWTWLRGDYLDGWSLTYAAEVTNESFSKDAVYFRGLLNVIDSRGDVVQTNSVDLSRVPAHRRAWVTENMHLSRGVPPFDVQLEVVGVEWRRAYRGEVPTVFGLGRDTCDPASPYEVTVFGQARTPFDTNFQVHVVAFDMQGGLRGGTTAYPASAPGVTTAWDATVGPLTCSDVGGVFSSIDWMPSSP